MKKLFSTSFILVQIWMMILLHLGSITDSLIVYIPFKLMTFPFLNPYGSVFSFFIVIVYSIIWAFLLAYVRSLIFKDPKEGKIGAFLRLKTLFKETLTPNRTWKNWRAYTFVQRYIFTEIVLCIIAAMSLGITSVLWGRYIYDYSPIFIIIALSSLLISGLWHLSLKFRKTKFALSVVSGTFVGLFFMLFLGVCILDVYNRIPSGYKYVESDPNYNYYPNREEGEYEYNEEYDEEGDYPWEGPERDEEFTEEAFKKTISDRSGYYCIEYNFLDLEDPDFMECENSDVNKQSLFINDLALFVARENDLLLAFYYKYSDYFYKNISLKEYRKYFRSDVKLLLYTYSTIEEASSMQNLMSSIYYKARNSYLSEEDINEILAQYSVSEMDLDREMNNRVSWAYTFWGRRNKENNYEAVINIIRKIDSYYSNLSENNQD